MDQSAVVSSGICGCVDSNDCDIEVEGDVEMNLNNWLCKHFDVKKKGYVTIRDIMVVLVVCLVYILTTVGVIYSVYRFFMEGSFYKQNPDMWSWHFLGGFVVVIVIVFLIVAVLAIIIYIIQYAIEQINRVFNIKIAKCPLKEGETK